MRIRPTVEGGDTESGSELDRSFPQPKTQTHTAFHHWQWCRLRAVMGPRRTILHRLASAITIHPAFDGRPRTLEPGSGLGNRDVVVNDALSNPQTSAWSQSCISVGHKRAFLAVDIFASPTQPARPSPYGTRPDHNPSTNLPGQYSYRHPFSATKRAATPLPTGLPSTTLNEATVLSTGMLLSPECHEPVSQQHLD